VKVFLDTANVDAMREAASWGILDGVTTNPTLLAKEGRKFEDVVREICEIVDGPINLEVTQTSAPAMIAEAKDLAKVHKNVVVKVQMTEEGLKAAHALKQEGVRTNMTLIFSANQALLAAKAGASYVSPFIGRLDDQGQVGMTVIEEIATIFDNYDFDCEIIVASIRHPIHVVEAAMLGAHIATVPWGVLQKMVKHPLTDIGLRKFLADWEKVEK
jgi:transaldolase